MVRCITHLPVALSMKGFMTGIFRISCCLSLDLVVVNDNLGMKNLLVDALVEIVGDSPDKHTLRQSRDLARRDKGVHLGVEGVAHILTVYRH